MTMDPDREQSLLALLEWEERRDRWLEVPPESRERVIEELARLMIRMAIEEPEHDSSGEDHASAP